MATSTVKLNGTTLMTVNDTTATDADVVSGEYFYAANGVRTLGQGNGGAGLPEVSSADNGDVLMVVGGEWDKADKGWNVSSTQLFSESVTTALDENGFIAGQLAYSQDITAPTLIINFNGTSYTCARDGQGGYGAPWSDDLGAYDFSTYPFAVLSLGGGTNVLLSANAGTYTVVASTESVTTTTNFDKAAQKAVGGGNFQITEGTTTFQEAYDAMTAGKIVTAIWGSGTVNFGYLTQTNTAAYRMSFLFYDDLNSRVATHTFSASSANDPLYD